MRRASRPFAMELESEDAAIPTVLSKDQYIIGRGLVGKLS